MKEKKKERNEYEEKRDKENMYEKRKNEFIKIK
jgi:hypothetical protein